MSVGTRRIAGLAMYDPPPLRAANDALWTAVARRLVEAGMSDVPARLDRAAPPDVLWRDPGLLLAQTCGYPLMTELGDAVAVVAAPVHALPGCAGATHRSFVVVASGSPAATLADLRGRRAAINGRNSNTGMNLFRHAVAPHAHGGRFFASVAVTGSHAASLAAVAEGKADVAAIDCVTFGLMVRHQPEQVEKVRVLAETAAGPALPFVTRGRTAPAEIAVLGRALAGAVADPANAAATQALALAGIEPAAAGDYAILLSYENEAADLGYPTLA